MGGTTGIEWTERTWNPIVGCSIVSPGCTNCYAMKMAARLEAMAVAETAKRTDPHHGGKTFDGPLRHYLGTTKPTKAGAVWTGKVGFAGERALTEPLRRKKPTMWFVNSMSDLFHEDVPDAWIDRVFAVMALTPHHTYQVLTKRSARMRVYVTRDNGDEYVRTYEAHWRGPDSEWCHDGPRLSYLHPRAFPKWPLPNVWLGVSAERQQEADARIPDLLATPAAVRFVSAEPLLGPIDFGKLDALTGVVRKRTPDGRHTSVPRLDWVIVGGESGTGARPMHPDWARSLRDQCASAAVPFFFKQWGNWAPGTHVPPDAGTLHTAHWCDGWEYGTETAKQAEGGHIDDEPDLYRVGKASAGRLLDGREHNDMPQRA